VLVGDRGEFCGDAGAELHVLADRLRELGLTGEIDTEVVFAALEHDPFRASEAVSDGGPSTSELCDEFVYERDGDPLRSMWVSAC
jgi:hypothetical protein